VSRGFLEAAKLAGNGTAVWVVKVSNFDKGCFAEPLDAKGTFFDGIVFCSW
jgi:hypothetical protein